LIAVAREKVKNDALFGSKVRINENEELIKQQQQIDSNLPANETEL